jgi:hypothetical protein
LLAILATARLISQDLEDRTIYSILAKAVRRAEYLAGKLTGVLSLLLISIVVLAALFVALLYLRQEAVISQTMHQMGGAPNDQIAETIRSVHAAAFDANLLPAIALIFVKAGVLAALTLLISTFATSDLFTIVVAFLVYFIGHLQGTARELWLHEQSGGWLSRAFLAVVTLSFPDLQQFNLADQISSGVAVPLALFLKTTALGCFYVLLYFSLGAVTFEAKEI